MAQLQVYHFFDAVNTISVFTFTCLKYSFILKAQLAVTGQLTQKKNVLFMLSSAGSSSKTTSMTWKFVSGCLNKRQSDSVKLKATPRSLLATIYTPDYLIFFTFFRAVLPPWQARLQLHICQWVFVIAQLKEQKQS